MGESISLGLMFLLGMVSFLSPCVLPVVPAYLSVISGLSYDELQQEDAVRQARWRLFGSALGFIFGFGVVTVLLLGGLASLVSTLDGTVKLLGNELAWRDIVRWVGGVVVIIFAIHLTGLVRITALFRERRFHFDGSKFGIFGAALVGAAFGFGWSPCIGPIMGSALAYAGSVSTPATAWSLFVSYTLGLAVPFLLAAVFVHLFLGTLRKFTRHLRTVEIVSGALLLVMGVLLITDKISVISQSGGFLLNLSNRLEEMIR